ncbi:MAG: radical SAM protein [Sedimentisphaerales bacterium]|nr:radical SAM protein [Sedimentisphaerales bacterium]
MNIVYLNGPFQQKAYSRSSRSPAVTKSGTLYYPIWLSYAAGLARQETDYHIQLIDAVAQGWDTSDLINYLKGNRPDLLFCDTTTPSIKEDIATVTALKEAFPQCRTVLVGTHATALPEVILRDNAPIDAVARGEYDLTAIEMARALDEGRSWETLTGVCLPDQNEILYTADRELIVDLDRFPFVSKMYRDFLRLDKYFFAAGRFPMVMTITSRGCPYRCQWCLYPQVMHGGMYRTRSSQNVADEFAFISEEMPMVKEVGIEDDLFTADKQRLHDICRLLIKQNNRLKFWCDTRVDLDYDTMRLMKAAGCRLLIAGFESGSQPVLDRINKRTTVEQAYMFMSDARRADLLVHGCFVLGNPGETRRTMRATLDLAKRLDPDTAQFFPMMVYPGTTMYNWVREKGYLQTENFNEWLTPEGLHNSVVDLPGLSAREILRFCDHARREFYLRRRYIFRKLKQSIVNPWEARRNVKAFRRFARHLIPTS